MNRRLKSGRNSDLLVHLALGEQLALTVKTIFARNVVENYHAVARFKTNDAIAHRGDRSCRLMTEDSRLNQPL